MAISTVKGRVARTFFDGRGAEVVETFEIKGKEITRRWACWFTEEHGLTEGDQVQVSGLHSDQVDEWQKDGETRHSVKRSLNQARIVTGDGATSPHAAQGAPDGPWGASPVPVASTDPWGVSDIPENPWPATEPAFTESLPF